MYRKGFAGMLVLLFGTIAAVLLYVAFTKKSETPSQSEAITPSLLITQTPIPTPLVTKSKDNTVHTSVPTSSNPTSVPIQITISPTSSFSNYPTSQPVSTATPSPTGKGKNGSGGETGIGTSG